MQFHIAAHPDSSADVFARRHNDAPAAFRMAIVYEFLNQCSFLFLSFFSKAGFPARHLFQNRTGWKACPTFKTQL
jgi:hypothetical protein